MTTAADILRGVPREKLNSPVTDIHIQEVASELKSWEELALYLSLTEAEEEEIRVDYQGRYGLQKREALRKWQQKLGKHGATYQALIVALCCAQQNKMAIKVKHLLSKPDKSDASSHILETFRGYLVDCYAEMPHPSRTQWPFSRMSSYVDLTLFEAPGLDEELSQFSGTDEQEERKPKPLKEVELENLFHVRSHQAKRKVVLIEGPAGCGKTTLSWHACREWAAGRLFQEFSLLIHVSLEDPAVHKAQCLADLIPCESSEMREAVAKAIFERRGKGVCFLFDAWDEAPRTLHHVTSFLYKFITGASTKMLPRCSIVITSRSVVAALLYPNLTTRVTIGEFNSTNVEKFIDISLGHNSDTKQRLLQALHATPELTSLCSLPINAAIVVHVFQSLNYKLPSTRTGLFRALVCNLLLRHMQLRTNYGLQELEVFESLPDDILQQFKEVCALAFHGIIEDRRLFDALKLAHPTSSLGLMQVHQQLTCYGPSHHYSFLHYAVQEFLAAYHISQCSEEEQTKVIKEILHSTPLSLVLPFYAGLTELATESARNILLKVTKFPLDKITVLRDKSFNTSSDKRMLLLALLNCIYESQNPTLCRLVNPPTNPEYMEQYYVTEQLSKKPLQQLDNLESILALTQLELTQADCLSVGYFILNSVHKRIDFDLELCYVSEAAVETLMKQLRNPCCNEPGHAIVLNNNHLTDKAVQSISSTLAQTSALDRLGFQGCFNYATSSDITVFLKYIIEGTSRNSTLNCLDLSNCCLGPEHGHHLALMIVVGNIQHLSLSNNHIGSAIPLIVTAITHSKVRSLLLANCCISDRDLFLIGTALRGNVSLVSISIEGNSFCLLSLTKFLQLLIFNYGLQFLGLEQSLTDEQNSIVEKINQARQIQKVGTKLCTVDMTPINRKLEDLHYLLRSCMTAMK